MRLLLPWPNKVEYCGKRFRLPAHRQACTPLLGTNSCKNISGSKSFTITNTADSAFESEKYCFIRRKTETKHFNLFSHAYFFILTQICKTLRNACPDSSANHYTIFLPGLYPVCNIRIRDHLQSHHILKLFFEE